MRPPDADEEALNRLSEKIGEIFERAFETLTKDRTVFLNVNIHGNWEITINRDYYERNTGFIGPKAGARARMHAIATKVRR
jgi:hypothetical protein